MVEIEFIDDVFPEGGEQFEIYLSAAPGGFVVSPAYATVTILNDDPPLPGTITIAMHGHNNILLFEIENNLVC